MFLNLFLFYQVVRPLGGKSVNKYCTCTCTCTHIKRLIFGLPKRTDVNVARHK